MLHPSCTPCSKSELDLFPVPNVQTTIEESVFHTVHPLSTIGGNESPLEFFIPGSGEMYIDPSSIRIYLKLRIVKSDGTELDAACNVYGENYIVGSMFSTADISLNDVTFTTGSYPYRSYLETILNCTDEAKKTVLAAGGYFEDLDELQEFYKDKKSISVYGRIHSDILNSDRLILNNVSMKLRLIRSNNAFVLKTYSSDTNTYRLEVLDTYLSVRRVRLNGNFLLNIEKRLLNETAKYPLNRVVCRQYTINGGVLNRRVDNISLGLLPIRVILGIVDHASFSGIHKASGLKFQHSNIGCVDVHVNGVSTDRVYKVNYSDGKRDYSHALFRLHEVLNENDGSSGISRERYINDMNLYAFNLSPDYSLPNNEYVSPIKQGTLSVSLDFNKTLSTPVSLIVLLEYDHILEIDRSRNILVNY